MALQAETAFVWRDGVEVELPLEAVGLDNLVSVRPGTQVPVDGCVVEGTSSLDESMMTGESLPVFTQTGDTVAGGTLNLKGWLKVRTTRIGVETALARIIAAVEDAQGSKAPIQGLADRISAVFVPAVLVLAVVTLASWLAFGIPTLGLAAPTAVVVAVGKGAACGILFRDAEALEKLASVDTVVFDKTGTLTVGKPAVTRIAPRGPTTANELLRWAAALEAPSEHPLAQAILDRAATDNLLLAPVDGFWAHAGQGVEGRVEGRRLWLGLEDALKPAAVETIARLHKLGIKTVMLIGDREETARAVAAMAGIDTVLAQVLPNEKADKVAALMAEGRRVLMAGDGVNDAPALARADGGLAMATGTDAAIQSAAITLLGGDLARLPQVVILGRKTLRTIRQNLFWAFGYNLIGLPLAAGLLFPWTGWMLNPVFAGAATALSSVSVVTNSVRLKGMRL